jgi:hypothetical protein
LLPEHGSKSGTWMPREREDALPLLISRRDPAKGSNLVGRKVKKSLIY